MVRKQIYIPRRQDILIKRLSQTKGLSEAEIIRQAIEREINRELYATDTDAKSAWDEIIQFIEERKASAEPAEPIRWNREEIYAERENRWLNKDK
jgi:hypothetical protein